MASLFGRTVTSITCRLLNSSSGIRTKQCLALANQLKCVAGAQNSVRGLARSYWSLCSMSKNSLGSSYIASDPHISKKCGCCSLHTEGDTEFSKFLEKEIGVEQSSDRSSMKLPEIKDWQITTDVSKVTMTKSVDGETVTIKFNTVDTVVNAGDSFSMEEGEEGQDNVNMVSQPDFTVDIKKSSGKVLSLKCSFPLMNEMQDPEAITDEQADAEHGMPEDEFEIDAVSIYEDKESDATYSVMSSVMDGTLYDMLMDMLDERGITNEFVDALSEYSTCYEQRQYVKFLTDLKSFVEEK